MNRLFYKQLSLLAVLIFSFLSINAMQRSRQPSRQPQPMMAHSGMRQRDVEVRSIVFAMDKGTINLLLAHDPKTNRWTVFSAPKKLQLSSGDIRSNQTNQLFDEPEIQTKIIESSFNMPADHKTGDLYYHSFYREIPIAADVLNAVAANKFRDQFVYMPLSNLVSGRTNLSISPSLVAYLKTNYQFITSMLTTALQALAPRPAPAPYTPTSRVQPAPQYPAYQPPAPMLPVRPPMILQPQPVRDVHQQINGAISMIEESGFHDQFDGNHEGFRILEKLAIHGNNELVKEALLKLLTNPDQDITWPAKRLFEKLYGQSKHSYTAEQSLHIIPPQIIQETIIEQPVQLPQPTIAAMQPSNITNVGELQQTVEEIFNKISAHHDRTKRHTTLDKLQKDFVNILFSICWQLVFDLREERFNTFNPAKQQLVTNTARAIIPVIENIDYALIPLTEPKYTMTFADYVLNNWLPMQQPLLSNAALNQNIQVAKNALMNYKKVTRQPLDDFSEQMDRELIAKKALMDSIKQALKSAKALYQENGIWR